MDTIFRIFNRLEKKEEYMNTTLYEMKGDLKTLGYDINSIKEDIHEMKANWKK